MNISGGGFRRFGGGFERRLDRFFSLGFFRFGFLGELHRGGDEVEGFCVAIDRVGKLLAKVLKLGPDRLEIGPDLAEFLFSERQIADHLEKGASERAVQSGDRASARSGRVG